jgi:hypothetical protein
VQDVKSPQENKTRHSISKSKMWTFNSVNEMYFIRGMQILRNVENSNPDDNVRRAIMIMDEQHLSYILHALPINKDLAKECVFLSMVHNPEVLPLLLSDDRFPHLSQCRYYAMENQLSRVIECLSSHSRNIYQYP